MSPPSHDGPTADVASGDLGAAFDEAWAALLPIGRDPQTGGMRRHGWTDADLACRAWFRDQAARRGMPVEMDANGNLWAWWGDPNRDGTQVIATGSHLDSVPNGGAYDGPLGVVSAFVAIDLLRERDITPARPVGVVAWAEEEGSRFGLSCLGSRLATGLVDADHARDLRDSFGVTLADAIHRTGGEPDEIGPTPDLLGRIAAFVELHIEQGRGLVELDAPVGVATGIWPHGRWHLAFEGVADHAGTTRLPDRRDPMLTFATTALAARKRARLADALATVGRVEVQPNGTNAIPARVDAWLDARAADEETLTKVVDEIVTGAHERAGRDGTSVTVTAESMTSAVSFDDSLRQRVTAALGPVPELPTGAGHDAGILASALPTAMLFVRNPTGASHTPDEHADRADCLAGIEALATTLEDLLEERAGA